VLIWAVEPNYHVLICAVEQDQFGDLFGLPRLIIVLLNQINSHSSVLQANV
jgi:hypothetical protein